MAYQVKGISRYPCKSLGAMFEGFGLFHDERTGLVVGTRPGETKTMVNLEYLGQSYADGGDHWLRDTESGKYFASFNGVFRPVFSQDVVDKADQIEYKWGRKRPA